MGYWDKITDLPAIAQSVIGSAVFLVLYSALQRVAKYAATRFSSVSKRRRRTYLLRERLRCIAALTSDDSERAMLFGLFAFGALSSLARAALAALLAFLLGKLWALLAVVGAVFSLFYVVEALADLKDAHSSDPEELKRHLKQVEQELATLKTDA